jgi:hypothetical protein
MGKDVVLLCDKIEVGHSTMKGYKSCIALPFVYEVFLILAMCFDKGNIICFICLTKQKQFRFQDCKSSV